MADVILDSPDHFRDHVGSTFVAQAAGRSLGLVLHVVEEGSEQQGAPRRHPFSLTFLGPAEEALEQGTHELRHAVLGSFALFLVPRQPRDGRRPYEAVFN